jgi:hypothetical protein
MDKKWLVRTPTMDKDTNHGRVMLGEDTNHGRLELKKRSCAIENKGA